MSGTPATLLDIGRSAFDAFHSFYESSGLELVDIEIVYRDGEERFSATWADVPGEVHTFVQGSASQWSAFLSTVGALQGRFLDIEVGYFGGSKRWSGLFYEDGDDYAFSVRTTNTDSEFQDRMKTNFDAGLSIVDFEAYDQLGSGMRFAGVWVNDPNQPRTVLFYDLKQNQLQDFWDLKTGRIIDYERYFNTDLNGTRYALVLEMTAGGFQAIDTSMTKSEVQVKNASFTDADTFLIDIEPYEDGSTERWGGIWGDNFKSLSESARIPSDTNVEASGGAGEKAMIFESNGAGSRMGIWAYNVRTGQTIAVRGGEPFYLASTAKIAIHFRLWKAFQDFANGIGGLDPTTLAFYTQCSGCRNNWYVDNRPSPGLNSNDFGNRYSLTRFDQAMMQVSDNAATSLLVDHATLGLLNQPGSLNRWLAELQGVGQGFFPVTSIHEVDRTILWQSQVRAFPNDVSLYGLPAWSWEPLWRQGQDTYCDLANQLSIVCNGSSYPRFRGNDGHERYYNMGLNSSSPRALGRLLGALVEGELLNPAFAQGALDSMAEGTPLDNDWTSAQRASVVINAKGGVKGGTSAPVSDAGIVSMGPDAIVMVVLTKDNAAWGGSGNVRSFTSAIGRDLLEQLGANLTVDGTPTYSPSSVSAGDSLSLNLSVDNEGGGDAGGFTLELYLSEDTAITADDTLINTLFVDGLQGYDDLDVGFDMQFPPGISPGAYNIGWLIDRTNQVGEWDETVADNSVSFGQITVVESTGVAGTDRWVVPRFVVDARPGTDEATFWAVRNEDNEQVTVDITYRDVLGEVILTETEVLDVRRTVSRNLGNVNGLLAPGTDLRVGSIWLAARRVSALEADDARVSIDTFTVDTLNNFAGGGRAQSIETPCSRWNVRFLNFGSGPSDIDVLVEARGALMSDPATVFVKLYKENGTFISTHELRSDQDVFAVDLASLASENFGVAELDFGTGRSGVVSVRHSAFGKFSVAHEAYCAN